MPKNQKDFIDTFIGARLRMRRLMLNMSQEALGERLSLTFQQIQKYEKGINRISASRLYEISKILDVPLDYFFEALESEHAYGNKSEGMYEDEQVLPPYLNLVSSIEGKRLNMAFASIRDPVVRKSLLDLICSMAEDPVADTSGVDGIPDE